MVRVVRVVQVVQAVQAMPVVPVVPVVPVAEQKTCMEDDEEGTLEEETCFTMTEAHDLLVDGVLDDVDQLCGSLEYWQSIVTAPGGPIAVAKRRAYNRRYRRRSLVAGTAAVEKGEKGEKGVEDEAKKDHSEGDASEAHEKEQTTSVAVATTLEDIEQILYWRKTSCGIDDVTLASLLIGRGGGVKVTMNHPLIRNDTTFEVVGGKYT